MDYAALMAKLATKSQPFADSLRDMDEASALPKLRDALNQPAGADLDALSTALNAPDAPSLLSAAAPTPEVMEEADTPDPTTTGSEKTASGKTGPEKTDPGKVDVARAAGGDAVAQLGSKIAPVAPALAGLLASGLQGTALQQLGLALVGDSDATAQSVLDAVGATGWEDKVREAQAKTFQQIGQASSLVEAALAYGDAAQARQTQQQSENSDAADREKARARQATAPDWWVNPILAGAVTLGFFWMLSCVLHDPLKADSSTIADTMLGVLGTAWVAIITFYFGSSNGSKVKTTILAAQLDNSPVQPLSGTGSSSTSQARTGS